MTRAAGYREAIQWIAVNDDTEFLNHGPDAQISVTAALVADLYRKADDVVAADLRKAVAKLRAAS